MSSNITLSQAVRSNLLSLQNTASLLDTTQTRLATGNKVNSALDNPTSYFTAASLNSRASDLGNLLDSVSNAVQTIQAANDGITSITKLVASAQATANQAQQLSETVDTTVPAAGGTVTSSVVVNPSAAGTLTINGQNVSVAATVAGAAGTVTGSAAATVTADGTLTISGRSYSLTAGSAAQAGTVTGSAAASATADGTLTINGRSYSVTTDHAGTVTSSAASTVTADGTLTINGRNYSLTAGHAAAAGTSTGSTTGLAGTDLASAAGFVNGNTLNISTGSSTVAITFDNSGNPGTLDATTATVQDVIDEINNQAGGSIASLDGNGSIAITGAAVTDDVTITGTNGAGLASSTHTTFLAADDATSIAAQINGDSGADFSASVGTGPDAGKLIITGNTSTTDVNVTATVAGVGLTVTNHAHTAADDATSIAAQINGDSGADFSATVGTGPDAGKLIITGNTSTTDVDVTATVAGLGLTVNNNTHTAAVAADDATSIAALINADSSASFTASVGTGGNAGKLIVTGKTATDDVNVTATVAGTGLSVGNNAHTAAVTGDDATSLAAKINGTSGIGVTATVGTGANAGKLTLTASTTTGDVNITATVAGTGFATGNNAHTLAAPGSGPNPARQALIAQYNGLLDQIDQLTADAGYNGNNLLAGTTTQLKVVFNETGTSNLTISGKDASSTGLGLSHLASSGFDTNAGITTILGTLKTATDTLRADASSFGSNLSIVQTRQDFTKALINTLQTGASNLTLADSNEEAANLLALQTRQSLSTKALSLASQSDQNVLRLLQ